MMMAFKNSMGSVVEDGSEAGLESMRLENGYELNNDVLGSLGDQE
jgi:hypothetical protein